VPLNTQLYHYVPKVVNMKKIGWNRFSHFHVDFFINKVYRSIIKTWSTQRAQTSAVPEDPDFGLWTPGSEAWSGSPL